MESPWISDGVHGRSGNAVHRNVWGSVKSSKEEGDDGQGTYPPPSSLFYFYFYLHSATTSTHTRTHTTAMAATPPPPLNHSDNDNTTAMTAAPPPLSPPRRRHHQQHRHHHHHSTMATMMTPPQRRQHHQQHHHHPHLSRPTSITGTTTKPSLPSPLHTKCCHTLKWFRVETWTKKSSILTAQAIKDLQSKILSQNNPSPFRIRQLHFPTVLFLSSRPNFAFSHYYFHIHPFQQLLGGVGHCCAWHVRVP
jgi:hypothetical protein